MIKYTTHNVIEIRDMEDFLFKRYGDSREDIWTVFAEGYSNESYYFIDEERLDDMIDDLLIEIEETGEDDFYGRKIKILEHLKEAMKENEVPKNFLITIWW